MPPPAPAYGHAWQLYYVSSHDQLRAAGWVTNRRGYRYAATDPTSGQSWPVLPAAFQQLATTAATVAGFPGFEPDACLLNRYAPGTRLTLHQDKDERGFTTPIVSVALGIPTVFLFGGLRHKDPVTEVLLTQGAVIVWGSADRLRYPGVLPMPAAHHPLLGGYRFNLTFRHAG